MRVSMSAIGSVIVTARCLLSARGPSPGALRHARNLTLVRHLAQAQAAQPEVAVHRARASATTAARVAANLELRCPLLLLYECFLSHRSPLAVTTEREAQRAQQRTSLVIRHRRSNDRDVHTPNRVDPVVVDFREHELFREPEGVVAAAVELTGRHPAKVTDAWDRQAHQPV